MRRLTEMEGVLFFMHCDEIFCRQAEVGIHKKLRGVTAPVPSGDDGADNLPALTTAEFDQLGR